MRKLIYWVINQNENGTGINLKKSILKMLKKMKVKLSNAQNSLGLCYENGTGTEKDLEKAFYWYQKAAENGNKVAQYNLAICYENGEGVIAQTRPCPKSDLGYPKSEWPISDFPNWNFDSYPKSNLGYPKSDLGYNLVSEHKCSKLNHIPN